MCVSFAHNKTATKYNSFYIMKIIRQIFAFVIVIFALFIFMRNFIFNTSIVYAENDDGIDIETQLENETDNLFEDVDFSAIEDSLNDLDYDFNLFNGLGFKEFVYSIIHGEQTISLKGVLDIVLGSLKEGIKNLLAPLTIILMIVLLCTMFNNIKSDKVHKVGDIIYFVCFSIIVIIVASISAKLLNDTKNSLVRMQSQMNAIFPILISLMTIMGGVVSIKAYTPLIAFLSNSISNIFIYVLLPLFSFSLILSFIGNLSDNTRLTKLNGFIGSLFKWIIGVTFTIFISFLSIQGITAGAKDGISIKATKYAIKNYIPLLGGYISDGFELVKASGLLIKNATGFAGIVMLFATIIVPIMSIGLLELGLKLLAGIIEPIGDNKSSNLLYSVAKSLKLLVAIIIGVSLMYFLTIFLITCSVANFV